MMIKMLVGLSGPALCLSPGDEHDFPAKEARRLIKAGAAVPAVPEKLEKATKQTPGNETR